MRQLDEEEEQDEQGFWTGPIKLILGLFILLILIITLIPYSSVRLDPSPKKIPGKEIIPDFEEIDHVQIKNRYEYNSLLSLNDPELKSLADRIVTTSCDSNKICYSKALYYFVIENFDYVNDPLTFEYVKNPKETLTSGGGDCDDASVLLAQLHESIGIRTRFVFIPRHVYIEAYLPEALSKYKVKDSDWVPIDGTCSNCGWGEIPYNDAAKSYLD